MYIIAILDCSRKEPKNIDSLKIPTTEDEKNKSDIKEIPKSGINGKTFYKTIILGNLIMIHSNSLGDDRERKPNFDFSKALIRELS